VLSGLTRDSTSLRRTLETQPELTYGTRIYDAITRSLALLRDAKLSSSSIVLLSDGADIGSLRSLDQAVAAAKDTGAHLHVGLRRRLRSAPLRTIAERTAVRMRSASAEELAAVYEELGTQLAGEYLVRYRSGARPMAQVDVRIDVAARESIDGLRRAHPSLLAPYHRSAISTFCSRKLAVRPGAHPGLLVCGLSAARARPKTTVVDRVERFANGHVPCALRAQQRRAPAATSNRYATGWWRSWSETSSSRA
jgi:hypothetical protein